MSRPVIAALIAGLFLMAPAGGATGTTSFRDIANDANGLNGQEHGGGNGIATGRASIDAVDIRRVTLSRIDDRDGDVQAIRVTMTLSSRPARGFAYHVSATGEGCHSLIMDHYRFRDGGTRTQLRISCAGDINRPRVLVPARVDGSTITIKVPVTALPRSVRQEGSLSRLYAYTRGNLGDAPVFPFPVTPVQFDSIESNNGFRFRR